MGVALGSGSHCYWDNGPDWFHWVKDRLDLRGHLGAVLHSDQSKVTAAGSH